MRGFSVGSRDASWLAILSMVTHMDNAPLHSCPSVVCKQAAVSPCKPGAQSDEQHDFRSQSRRPGIGARSAEDRRAAAPAPTDAGLARLGWRRRRDRSVWRRWQRQRIERVVLVQQFLEQFVQQQLILEQLE